MFETKAGKKVEIPVFRSVHVLKSKLEEATLKGTFHFVLAHYHSIRSKQIPLLEEMRSQGLIKMRKVKGRKTLLVCSVIEKREDSKFVRKYLMLPHIVQFEIWEELGIYKEGDEEGLSHAAFNIAMFLRIKQQNRREEAEKLILEKYDEIFPGESLV